MKAIVTESLKPILAPFNTARVSPGIWERVERRSDYYFKYMIVLEDKSRLVVFADESVASLNRDDSSGQGEAFRKVEGKVTILS